MVKGRLLEESHWKACPLALSCSDVNGSVLPSPPYYIRLTLLNQKLSCFCQVMGYSKRKVTKKNPYLA